MRVDFAMAIVKAQNLRRRLTIEAANESSGLAIFTSEKRNVDARFCTHIHANIHSELYISPHTVSGHASPLSARPPAHPGRLPF